MDFQVTFDAANPRKLADFWAYALRYRRDDPPAGFDSWDAFLAHHNVPQEKWENADAIIPKEGNGPRIYFQKVPEPKTVKNRVHLDLRVAEGLTGEKRMSVLEAFADELESRGATRMKRVEPEGFGLGFIIMNDPEGNEFCLD